jgi:dolichol-phosphate mannosyltransferase
MFMIAYHDVVRPALENSQGIFTGTVAVVLPAFNEAANLPGLFSSIARHLDRRPFSYMVLVVDDGSADSTPAVLEEWGRRIPLRHFRHPRNLGLGPTIRDCLRHASELLAPGDIVASMDADETHDPDLIPMMIERIQAGDDVVIASRYRPGARVQGLAWHRTLISQMASILFRAVFPIPGVRDYTCGFRAYRVALLQRAFQDYGESFVDQQGFQCMADILLKLRRYRPRVGELPFVLRYDLKAGSSKMKLARTTLATLRLMLKRRLRF